VTRGDLVIDRRDWPRGADSGYVVCQYIAAIGLRPEDTFGVMPSGQNSRDLLFVYRDRPEYAAARRAGASGGLTAAGMPAPGGPVPADVSEVLAAIGVDLAGYGVDIEQRGVPAPPVPLAAGTIVIHGLQWPGTSRLDSWRPAAAAFNFYRDLTGLRPEDVYGYVPASWQRGSGDGDSDKWLGFNLIYRDRPGYAPGRAVLATRKGRYEFGELSSYGGAPDAPLAPERSGAIRVDEQSWPRRRLVLKLKHERMIEYLAQEIPARGALPEDSYGPGPDRLNEHLWHASLSNDRGPTGQV
jgi:hypothetical protein